MNVEALREYCLSKNHVTESFPFNDVTLVFKVGGKMFALLSLDKCPASCNLKCNPEEALLLRAQYTEIIPAYHMNKIHWNTVVIEGSLTNSFIKNLIDQSYNLVVKGLSKKTKIALGFIKK